jgi:DNA modification methylase
MRNDWHVEDGWRICLGECIDRMADIPDGSVDMVMADLPYGTTACKWDSVIPFEPLWAAYRNACKKNAAIVLAASQPFTSALVMSNTSMFKYCWYWKKERGTGFSASGKRPLMIVEDMCVFYEKQPSYNAIRRPLEKPYRHVLPIRKAKFEGETKMTKSVLNGDRQYREYTHETPTQLLEFSRDGGCRNSLHPTQKPVALMEYLIKTYTNEGETVLDNTMGSGTTGVACANTKRRFIGIEQDPNYYEVAKNRIAEAFVPKPRPETLFSENKHGTNQA